MAVSFRKDFRSPFVLLGLALLLVYAVGATALMVTVKVLEPWERQWLIGFVVLFPIVMVGTMLPLVLRTRNKLLGRDGPGDLAFLKHVTPAELSHAAGKRRQDLEVGQLVQGSAKPKKVTDAQVESYVAEVFAYENEIFPVLEQDYSGRIIRDISMRGRAGQQWRLDGFFEGPAELILFEVRHIRPETDILALRRLYYRQIDDYIQHVRVYLKEKVLRLVLILATTTAADAETAALKHSLLELFDQKYPGTLQVRVFSTEANVFLEDR